MNSVTIQELTASYGDSPVLRGVNLTIAPSEIVAVLGPSGCGKTTLLRVLAGFMRATGGSIHIAAKAICGPRLHTPPERRDITIVPQDGALFPHLNVAANVGFGLRPRARGAERVAQLLEMTGLDDRAKSLPSQLSGGQQQRVALARALAPRPSLVLLDEPFSALDAHLRHDLRTEVRDLLKQEQASALIVTHDQAEALSIADRVAVMRDGQIRQIATPRTIYRRPADRWVAEFVGNAIVLPAERVDDATVDTVLGRLRLDGTVSNGEVLIRPEQLHLTEHGIDATITRLDYFGHTELVTARLGDGTAVTFRTSGQSLPTDDRIRLGVTGSAWGL